MGDVDPSCEYQLLAISKDEMENLYHAHLKQDHPEITIKLEKSELKAISQRIKQFFAKVT